MEYYLRSPIPRINIIIKIDAKKKFDVFFSHENSNHILENEFLW